jgi:5-methylcytosine-specific restriction enzyme subunit McrC
LRTPKQPTPRGQLQEAQPGRDAGRGGSPGGSSVRRIVLDERSAGVVERLDVASAAYLNGSGLAKASPMALGLYRIEPVGKVGSVRTPTL